MAAACVGVGAAGGAYAAKSHQAAEAARIEAEQDEERSRRTRERNREETVAERTEAAAAEPTDDRMKMDEQMKAAWTPEQKRIWEASLYTEMNTRVSGTDLGKEPGTLSVKSRTMFVEESYSIVFWGNQIDMKENNNWSYYIYDKDPVDQIIEECFGYPLEDYVEGTNQTLVQLQDDSYRLSGGDWGPCGRMWRLRIPRRGMDA